MAFNAVEAVGVGKPDDYILSPTKHAAELEVAAPQLAALLRQSALIELGRRYEDADADAVKAQQTFKTWAQRANLAVLATTTGSALVMAVGLLSSPLGSADKPLLITFGLFSVACGAFASMALFRVKEGHLLEEWMIARAKAETHRLSYFTAVVNEAVDSPTPQLEQLRLEYFRRYQLDLEVTFYRSRRADHRALAQRTLSLAALSVLLAAIASGAASILGLLDTGWAAIGALAVLGAALQSFGEAREGVGQDRRNAERYQRTLESLQSLRARLDEVRRAVADGARPVLVEYVAAVQDQISLEHRQWLEAAESTRAAVGRLEQALADATTIREHSSG